MEKPLVTSLQSAVTRYAIQHANADGLALTPVPSLRMMRVCAPTGPMHSTYRPLICLVLQGGKQMMVGAQNVRITGGQSVLVAADMPVVGYIVEASRARPYLAVAVELDLRILRELVEELSVRSKGIEPSQSSFVERTQRPLLDCALRLMELIERPEATSILQPLIMRELHYWLLSGSHAAALVALTAEDSRAARLATAIRILREEFRTPLAIERLARASAMSLTAFHLHFKRLTSLTPIQSQKRLRLIEARQLMQTGGWQASRAAFEVGYESVSQFTREYGRLFGAPPKQDALRRRRQAAGNHESPAHSAP